MACPACGSTDLSPVGDQFFCVGCGLMVDKNQQKVVLQGDKHPMIVGKQKTRWMLPSGQVIEFNAVIDQKGMFWIPAPVMMAILKANKVGVSILKKDGEKDDPNNKRSK